MNVRPFDWRDIPALSRKQDECVFLDSALLLTRGPLLLAGALLSYLSPATGIFTNVVEDEKKTPLIGQIIHFQGEGDSPAFAGFDRSAPLIGNAQPRRVGQPEFDEPAG